ncbi:MAG: hypothetical protein Q9165_008822 [Trypethelium subeluteriae]
MADNQSRIAQLAATISKNVPIVDSYLESKGIPSPSYDINGPTEMAIPPHEKDAFAAHTAALSATMELNNLLRGPKQILMSSSGTLADGASLHGIHRFDIDKAFPVGQESTYEEISQKCGLNVIDVRRVLRHAMTNGIFSEPRPGVVAHTAASKLLSQNGIVRDFVGASSEESMPAMVGLVDALSKWGFARGPEESGFCLAHNSSLGFWDFMKEHPERGNRWANAMSAYATTVPIDGLLKSIDWAALGEGPVVDIGGGHGPVSIELAKNFSELRFVVEDMDYVIAEGQSHVPEEFKDRVSFIGYDARTTQPVKNAPMYFMRAVLHNWPDASCVQILRNQIPALKKGARVIINETGLPQAGALPLSLEKRRRYSIMDLNMLAYFGSRERNEDDWIKIVGEADERFEVRFIMMHGGPGNNIIELTWKV